MYSDKCLYFLNVQHVFFVDEGSQKIEDTDRILNGEDMVLQCETDALYVKHHLCGVLLRLRLDFNHKAVGPIVHKVVETIF